MIIPAYNPADSIENAAKSVIEQDYRPLDIIIIDDGSKDNNVNKNGYLNIYAWGGITA